ncbi:MAG TPA: FHA domain-containing protein, partial [Longimicrobiaceae bacterium]|nr:FHA domain-containing protein [Longimicrobiaceae bacterium]
MIVEVLGPRGERTRLRLATLPLTVGRGFGNDLILDDPYVDGRHARIAVDEAGTLVVEDLGSVNGLATPGVPGRAARVEARPGARVRLGRTTLVFRDPDEEVPPALPDPGEGAEAVPAAGWPGSRAARIAVPAAACAAVAAHAWLGSYERSGASDALTAALGFAFVVAAWAGVWAVAGRVAGHRFHFGGHVAVASGTLLAGMAYGLAESWGGFLFPDNPVSAPVALAAWTGLAAALVAGHLGLASGLPRRRRWRAGLATGGVILLLAGASALAEDEGFSDVPTFSGVLKPVPARWVPTAPASGFGEVADELREQADALAA